MAHSINVCTTASLIVTIASASAVITATVLRAAVTVTHTTTAAIPTPSVEMVTSTSPFIYSTAVTRVPVDCPELTVLVVRDPIARVRDFVVAASSAGTVRIGSRFFPCTGVVSSIFRPVQHVHSPLGYRS